MANWDMHCSKELKSPLLTKNNMNNFLFEIIALFILLGCSKTFDNHKFKTNLQFH